MGQFFHSWSSLLNMKAFICSALLAVASAAPQLLGHGLVGHGVVGHGVVGHAVAHPVAYGDLAEASPYTYNYGVADEYSGAAFSQSESNDGTGAVSGSYSVNLPDGRVQTVTYHANDAEGYVADVTYSGTAAYPEAVPVAHAVAHPVAHAVAHPVAVAHAAPLVHTVAHPVAHAITPVAH